MAQQEPAPYRRSPRRFGTIVTGLLAGLAGGMMAPLILPAMGRNFRPASKRLFKTGIALYERGRERAAELGEAAGDIMAEARAEYDAERTAAGAEGGDAIAANDVVRLRSARGKEAGSPNA